MALTGQTNTDRRFGISSGVAVKAACVVASTGSLTLSSTQVIDGIAVGNGERVMVKDQVDAKENGIYISSGSTWLRDSDFDGRRDAIPGTFLYVDRGTTYADTFWVINSSSTDRSTISIGTEDIDFSNITPTLTDASGALVVASGSSEPRRLDVRFGETPSLKDDGATGDGVTIDTVQAQSVITAQAGKAILAPKGTFKLGEITIPSGGLTIEGQGYDTVLEVASTEQILLSIADGSWLRLYNIRLKGDGTATASSDGIGLLTSRTDNIDLDTVWFEQFGFAGWSHITGNNPASVRIRGRNLTCLNMKDGVGSTTNHCIHLRGAMQDIQLRGILMEASTANPVAQGLTLVQATTSGEAWNGAFVEDITVRDVKTKAINYASEASVATSESGKASLIGAKVFNSGASAFKTKNVQNVRVLDFYAEGCDASPEVAGNLQGTMLINGCENFYGGGIELHDCGTDGMRFQGRSVGSTAGAGRSKKTIDGLIVQVCEESGLFVGHNTQDLVANSPQVYDSSGVAYRILTTTALAPPQDITLNSPKSRRSRSSAIGITGLSTGKVGPVYINTPNLDENGGFGIVSDEVEYLQVNGGWIKDSGQETANKDGIRIANTDKFKLNGVRSSNSASTEQTYGLSLGGGNVDGEVHLCDFEGNATDRVNLASVPSGKFYASDNAGWLTSSSTFDPGSIAAGEQETTTVTVTDALLGDYARASFSISQGGLELSAFVSASSQVTCIFANNSTVAIDIGNGVLKTKVSKG